MSDQKQEYDIYTLEPISVPSREHVVPSFLGGRLQPVGLIDRATNTEFGEGIDSALEKALRFVRVPIDARGHRNSTTPPSPMRDLQGEDGNIYDMMAGGELRAKPELRVEANGTSLSISGSVPDEAALRNALKKKVKKVGLDLNDVVRQALESATWNRSVAPAVTQEIAIYAFDVYRAIAKIACNFFALKNRAVFLRDSFDESRNFVLSGKPCATTLVQAVDVDIRQNGIGPVDHLVTYEQQGDGRVVGNVVLYGVLAFSVLLGFHRDEVGRHSYRVDQLTGGSRSDHASDLEVSVPPFADLARRSHEAFTETATLQVTRALEAVSAVQREIWLHGIVESAWDKLPVKEGDVLEEEHINALVAGIVAQLEPWIYEASDRRRMRNKVGDADCGGDASAEVDSSDGA